MMSTPSSAARSAAAATTPIRQGSQDPTPSTVSQLTGNAPSSTGATDGRTSVSTEGADDGYEAGSSGGEGGGGGGKGATARSGVKSTTASNGGTAATTSHAVRSGTAGGGGGGSMGRSASYRTQASFQAPAHAPPPTPAGSPPSTSSSTVLNHPKVVKLVAPPSPPITPRSPTTAGQTPSDSTESDDAPSLSEVERFARSHGGRVSYETSLGRPLPLGNIAEAPTTTAAVAAEQRERNARALGKKRTMSDSALADVGGQVGQDIKDSSKFGLQPIHPLPAPSLMPHLPNLAFLQPSAPTSLPIPTSAVQRDLDASLGRLLSEDVFFEMLRNTLGRHRFRAYLMGLGKEEVLDLWWDAEICEQMAKMVKNGASAIQSVYFEGTEGALEKLAPGSEAQLVEAQRLDSTFSALSKSVLSGMYRQHFKTFIQRKLVEMSHVRLGFSGSERENVGEVFCITNPRLRDNPIVLVSEAFCKMTGYAAEAILGRNCRFLQGPGTSPASVERIRHALISGEEHTELLLNYTGAGTPFWNLLCLVPLRARDGSVAYVVGGQIDVTGSIQSSRKLSFLIGGASSNYSAEGISKLNTFEFSPTLLSQRPKLGDDLRDFQGGDSEEAAREREISASQGRDRARIGGLSTGARQELEGSPYDRRDAEDARVQQSFSDKVKTRFKHLLTGGEKSDDQLLEPAEKSWQSAGPLGPQLDLFSQTYTKLLILRPKNHEILYATRALISFLGLPIISSQDLFSCCLLHVDLLTLLELGSREATRRARDKIRQAVKASQPVSVIAGLRVLPQSVFSLTSKGKLEAAQCLKKVALHLTPLTDRDGVTGAYICIVS